VYLAKRRVKAAKSRVYPAKRRVQAAFSGVFVPNKYNHAEKAATLACLLDNRKP